MSQPRVVIIGAGPAGMSSAYLLAKAGARVDVFEAGAQVGGLTRSFPLWGETVDLGPHIFAGYRAPALALWRELIGDDHRELARDTRISIRGRVYRYPLKPGELLRGLGARGVGRAGLGYLRARVQPQGRADSAQRYFCDLFGTHLYDFFFAPYCRKLWGIDPAEVDVTFARSILGDTSIANTLRNLVRGTRSQREASLQSSFPYAREGSGAFCERAARALREHGGSVHLRSPVARLVREADAITGIELGGEVQRCDWVISSMPLGALIRGLGDVPIEVTHALQRLRFRSTILVYLRVRGPHVLPHLWMYVNDTVQAGRITNFAVWQGEPTRAQQTIAVEYWCEADDALWRSDDAALRALATRELSQAVQRDLDVLDAEVHRVRSSHPLYYRGYRDDVARAGAFLARFAHLSVIGRAGSYEYDAQARALEVGIETASAVAARLGLRAADLAGVGHGAAHVSAP